MIAVQKSCIHASAVAVFVEWWIVVFVDIVSFHRGICTLGASLSPALQETIDRILNFPLLLIILIENITILEKTCSMPEKCLVKSKPIIQIHYL